MLPGYKLPPRTRLACRLLKWFTVFVGIAYIVFYFRDGMAASIIDNHWNQLTTLQKDAVVYSGGKKLLLTAIATVGWFSPILIVCGIYRVFAALQKGSAFALPVVTSLRFLGLMIIAHLMISFSVRPLMFGALTFDSKGEDTHVLSIAIGTGQAQLLLFGALFLIIGQILTQAVRISDENRQIV